MPDSFTPFLPRADGLPSSGSPSTPDSSQAPFIPLTGEQSPPTQAASFAPAPGTVCVPAAAPNDPPPHAPTVTLKREGDRIVQIQICCACGERMHLDCQY